MLRGHCLLAAACYRHMVLTSAEAAIAKFAPLYHFTELSSSPSFDDLAGASLFTDSVTYESLRRIRKRDIALIFIIPDGEPPKKVK